MFLNINYLFVLILCLTVLNHTHAQKQRTDLDQMDLSGQIQTASRVEYSVNDAGEFVQEASYTVDFNKQGNTLNIKHYDRELRLDSKTIFEYDQEGRLIRSKKYAIYASLDSILRSKDTLIYHSEEKKIVLDHYTARGVLKGKTIMKKGLVEIRGYDPDGTVMTTKIQTLNKKGKRVCEANYIKDQVFRSKMTWKYSKKKVLIKRYKKDGSLANSSIQILDANGNVISWSFPALKKETKYEYKYDDQKNWTQKITYRKGKVAAKVEQVISYY